MITPGLWAIEFYMDECGWDGRYQTCYFASREEAEQALAKLKQLDEDLNVAGLDQRLSDASIYLIGGDGSSGMTLVDEIIDDIRYDYLGTEEEEDDGEPVRSDA